MLKLNAIYINEEANREQKLLPIRYVEFKVRILFFICLDIAISPCKYYRLNEARSSNKL